MIFFLIHRLRKPAQKVFGSESWEEGFSGSDNEGQVDEHGVRGGGTPPLHRAGHGHGGSKENRLTRPGNWGGVLSFFCWSGH